jgi:hypothetical protein
MTCPPINVPDMIQMIGQMQRRATRNGKIPYCVSMHPDQWNQIVEYVIQAGGLTEPPKELLPIIEDTLGQIAGMPVIPMHAAGCALHYA